MRPISVILVIALSGAGGCATKARPVVTSHSDMKVSVTSNGKPVKNFESELVHRIELAPNVAKDLARRSAVAEALPFRSAAVRDGAGRIKGVRVERITGQKGIDLGLKSGDVITAVELKHATSLNDLRELFQSVVSTGNGTFTFERSGLPHKTLVSTKSGS